VKPRIVGEETREFRVREPPPFERTRRHYWLKEDSEEIYNEALSKNGFLPLYISRKAEEKMRNHSLRFKDQNLEVMGFLLGDVFRVSKFRDLKFALAKDTVTSGLTSSSVSVKFNKEGLGRLFESLDDVDFDYIIVGWYHSHPGHTCFMSETDVETQRSMFREEFHSAVVIDPINMEMAAYGMEDDQCKEKPFAVYWDSFEDPYGKMNKVKFGK
jgi:proteasome lid subunit RPN8/RPN11